MKSAIAAAFAIISALTLSACNVTTNSSGYNRVMSVTNSTGITMTQFYASNTGQNTWGPDQLGSSVLYSGNYMNFNFDDGTSACHFDFRAVFSNGSISRRDDVNVCVETGITFH